HFHPGGHAHALCDELAQGERVGLGITVELDGCEPLRELAAQRRWQRIRVLHGVELYHAARVGDGISVEREDLRPHEALGSHSYIMRAARACAGRPSASASVAASRPRACAPAGDTSMMLVRFWKSYTPSGEEKRALPAVGSTWFGPAQSSPIASELQRPRKMAPAFSTCGSQRCGSASASSRCSGA